MTTDFGKYTIEIEADAAKLLAGQASADTALKQIENSVKKTANSADKLDKSLDNLGGGFSRLAVAVKGYISIQALIKLQQLSEEFTLLQARVTRLSSSSEEGARSFQQLVSIASTTGASLGDTVNLWQQLTATLKTVGATNSDVNRLVMTLQKIGTIGGSSAQEMANALRQFMQSVASGRIQAEEFNSVLEQMPELARQIADGMGIPFNELRQLMLAGKLDIGEVLAAIERRSDEINQQFEKMPRTVTQATNALVTQFGVAVSKIDDAIGASRYLAKLLDGAALSISVATGNAPDAVMLTQKLEQNTEQLAVAESDLAKARKAGLGWGVKQTEQTVDRLKAERALILMARQASKDSQSVYTPSKGEKPAYITNLEKKTAENNANSIIKSGQTVVDKLTQQREQLSKDKAKGLIDDKKYADAAAVLDKQITEAKKKQDKPAKNAFARGDDSIDNLQRQIAVLTMRYDENTREAAQFNAVAALGAKATDAQKERVRELAGQLFDAQQRQKDLNDAISNDPLRKENKAYSDGRDQLKRQLDGQMIDQKTYNQQSELMEQQHQVNLAKIRAQQVVTPQQQAAGEVDPVQRLANQHAQELELIQQFEQQKTITEQEALALRNAANNTYEKQRIEAQWEIFRNQSTTNELMAAAVDGFASQAASSMTGLINGTQSATEAFKNLGNAILNSVIQALVEVGIQYLKNAAMAMIADKMTSNSSQQAGAQTAAAWAPAAAAASIATFGGAAIAGIAGMVAAFAIGAALAGKRKNGGTVGAGGAYQVGEGNMPELLQTKNGLIMIPGDRGRVFSNKDVTGSSPTIQKASTGKEYLPTSSASSSQSGENSKRPIQVNIQLIDQTTGSQHNITGTDAFQQGDVVTVTGFLNDVDTGGPMSTAIADAHGLRRQARGAF
ncbi:phage tail length tape-measure protein 1 [Klebsiella pneumoniae]|uniref:tape measure protein n=1 Tax=Klebsiella pneumoniae TaxID=573 RepID=UPI000E2D684C|nr:tape measure protein [Klebsiella pneumoniae]SWC18233.1 phage tail length tape-measure protein 1 [Klebsiella pneumoniae]SWC24142.1 phage tail length tape-measure protein 1 [Klebsiella pneumoniae]SWC55696.1 phage tail length tape-measure protein 1 [Klebsiella pneumoniae]SWE44467.1 phage tail length tape-measure protein 1 [Klebsiella pneumoniae]SWF26371.1 phage tail length tape-measure protein 1 [Klebsiella pneumoniae]